MTRQRILRIVIAVLISSVGIILILMDLAKIFGASQTAAALLDKMGIALTVAGVVSLFHETLLRKLETQDTGRAIVEMLKGEWSKEAETRAEKTATSVCRSLRESPIQTTGIRLVSVVRKGWKGYYLWAVSNDPEEMFFAGRSVLHRIDQDLREREVGSAEEALGRRLAQGARIRMMFLDPKSDLVPRLAREEGQTPAELLSDIATSLGVCQRLYQLLRSSPPRKDASLDVRLYDEVPYFAYHRVDDFFVIGFYFQTLIGHSSAAYELVDQETKRFFEGHFIRLFDRAETRTVLRKYPHLSEAALDQGILTESINAIRQVIGDRVDDLVRTSPYAFSAQPLDEG